jgi:uncharacterized protein (DUF1697 family)
MHCVALLRGVNIGGRTIKSVDLTEAFMSAGLTDARTILQSGNVTFTSNDKLKDLQARLMRTLTSRFHYSARLQVIPIKYLKEVVAAYPFSTDNSDYQNYVVFFESNLNTQLVTTANTEPLLEKVHNGHGVIYWQVKKGFTLKSSFAQHLTKQPYKEAHTNRNMRTLQKILAATS